MGESSNCPLTAHHHAFTVAGFPSHIMWAHRRQCLGKASCGARSVLTLITEAKPAVLTTMVLSFDQMLFKEPGLWKRQPTFRVF
jgi:hypothetical protein